MRQNGIDGSQLFLGSGKDFGDAPSGQYDFVMSTICMQHIASHTVRLKILKDMFRVLKLGGWITIQMGFGQNHRFSVPYHADAYYAKATNGRCDTRVERPEDVENDLLKIGFESFEYNIDNSNVDRHGKWIYFRAQRPERPL